MSKWFPTIGQVNIGGRPQTITDYLCSVWVGFTAPILNFPKDLILTVLTFSLAKIVKFLLYAILVTFFLGPILGIAGVFSPKNSH